MTELKREQIEALLDAEPFDTFGAAEQVGALRAECAVMPSHLKRVGDALVDMTEKVVKDKNETDKTIRALARQLLAAMDRLADAGVKDLAAVREERDGALHRVGRLEAALSGGVLTKSDSANLLHRLSAAEADRDRLASELAGARKQVEALREAGAWRDPSEAPKDGTQILAVWRSGQSWAVVRWEDGDWYEGEENVSVFAQWRHLPYVDVAALAAAEGAKG